MVSRSSCESEYRALALDVAEVLCVTTLLHDLKISLQHHPLLLCDNKSAIFLSHNPMSHKSAKHIVVTIILCVNRLLRVLFTVSLFLLIYRLQTFSLRACLTPCSFSFSLSFASAPHQRSACTRARGWGGGCGWGVKGPSHPCF